MKLASVYVIIFVGFLSYEAITNPEWQIGLSHGLKYVLVPIVGPILALINTPAFVYAASFLILFAAIAIISNYFARLVRPRTRELRAARGDIIALPRGVDSAEAIKRLGDVLLKRGLFLSAWATFKASVARERTIPDSSFSLVVASDPTQRDIEHSGFMHALPGYFTWLGLILTFFGLVVALYFAARGFRSGNIDEARSAILQLLNAASFKFLTSVAALSSALLVSIAYQYGRSLLREENNNTIACIDTYISLWRAPPEPKKSASDSLNILIERVDLLISKIGNLTDEMQKITQSLKPESAHA